MDDGEVLLAFVGVLGGFATIVWQLRRWLVVPLGRERKVRAPFFLAYFFSFAFLILPALFLWSDPAVKTSPQYLVLLAGNGLVWLWLSHKLMSFTGVSFHLDVLGRNNRAAAIALAGGLIGVALVYCGSNTGAGPSLWNNVFSVLVGTLGFFVGWFIFESFGHISRSITEDRDLASGIRLAGLLVGLGLICGRAVAGNWVSMWATLSDFLRDGWWSVVVICFALLCETRCRPSLDRPFPDRFLFGIAPAVLFLVLSSVWLWHLGWWEGAK